MHILKQQIRNTCKWSEPFLFEKEQQFKRNKLFLLDLSCSGWLPVGSENRNSLANIQLGTINVFLFVVPYIGTKCSTRQIFKQIIAFEAELFAD